MTEVSSFLAFASRGAEAFVAPAARLSVRMVVDGCDRFVPMSAEEPRLVAAYTFATKLLEACGGVRTRVERGVLHVEGRVPVSSLDGRVADAWLMKGAPPPRQDAKKKGPTLAQAIADVSSLAETDATRAASDNQAVLDAVAAALSCLGQSARTLTAAGHAHAARSGSYAPLAVWKVEGAELVGRLSMPMPVGAACAIMNVHPAARDGVKASGVASPVELAALVAAAGLAHNLASLRTVAAERIQDELRRVRARSEAVQAGARGAEVQRVTDEMIARRAIDSDNARKTLQVLRAHEVAEKNESTMEDDVIDDPPATQPPASGVANQPRREETAQTSKASAADRKFCNDALPGVSRTFALSIQALPPDLGEAICVAYLLCRIVDTVEDDRRQTPAVRGALFDAFDRALELSAKGDGSLARTFETGSKDAGLGASDTEKMLCTGAGAVFRTFASLPQVQREAILPSVAEMSRGMRLYSERADAEGGLKLKDVEDLEKYCYYVAGTVGELLTALFRVSFPVSDKARTELEARAVAFGLGLQFVNILKDVAEDALRGDCFMPQKQAADLGLDLASIMVPSERPKGLMLLRALSARARVHLDRAEEYTLLWPVEAAEVRLFCTVPLALALATLREVELGDDALLPNRAPTVTRALVMKVFEDALTGTRSTEDQKESDRLLRGLFDRSRTGVIGRPPRPASTLPPTSAQSGPQAAAPGGTPPVPSEPPASTKVGVTGAHAEESKGVRMSASQHDPSSADDGKRRWLGLQPRREFGGKVLVTGAAGHVGANLVHRLLTDGRDVRVMLRTGSNNDAVDAIELALGKKVERVYGDLRAPREVAAAVKGCENIFHVAARVSTLAETPNELRDLYACNVIGTANLLRAAGDAGVKRTVVTGSLSAIGRDLDDPDRPSDESMPFFPFSEHLPYGRTKSLVEHEVLKAAVDGIDCLVATSCAVLGPWDYKPSRMGKTLIDYATGKLNAYLPGGFDFVSTKDLSDGHIKAMERGRSGQRYILSTEFATVDQLMDIFEEVSGRPRPKLRLPHGVMKPIAHVASFFMSTFMPSRPQRFTPHAVRLLKMSRRADTSRAQSELGYQPTSVRSAIHEAYADFARRGLVPQGPTLTRGDAESQRLSGEGATGEGTKAQEGAAA